MFNDLAQKLCQEGNRQGLMAVPATRRGRTGDDVVDADFEEIKDDKIEQAKSFGGFSLVHMAGPLGCPGKSPPDTDKAFIVMNNSQTVIQGFSSRSFACAQDDRMDPSHTLRMTSQSICRILSKRW